MIRPTNILVATDFGKAAESALMYGREFARAFGAMLHVLTVVEDIETRLVASEIGVPDFAAFQRDAEASARRRLDAITTDEDRQTLHARTVLRISNLPSQAIVEYAREANIDLIVIGTHGRGAWAHMLMGKVAEKVVRTAPCPVLTVHHPEFEFVHPDVLMTVERA
jgi:nucleotide-binding universal stress UspA family protein